MVTRTAGALVLALALSGCTGNAAQPPAGGDEPRIKLVAFDSCADTLGELRKAAAANLGRLEYRWLRARDGLAKGMPVPAAPGEATADSPDHSSTNNHEAGVDEADLVKTDGKRIVTLVDGFLRVVDVASRRVAGTLDLSSVLGDGRGGPARFAASQLLLHGSRALVIAAGGYALPYAASDVGKPVLPMGEPKSKVLLVELDGGPRVLGTLAVDGNYVDARQVGSVARVVVRSAPRLPYVYPDGVRDEKATEAANRKVIAGSTTEQWLPRYEVQSEGRTESGRVGCEHVVHPPEFTAESMLTVYSLDLTRTLTSGDPLTVLADGETVYGTGSSLYVAHDAYSAPVLRGRETGASQRTEVHRFDVSEPGRPTYSGSGVVPGALLNQYALSEHDGHLRMATTSTIGQATTGQAPCCDQAQTESSVYVLALREKSLVEVGRVSGLGKGERIYAVRFSGPLGYVVTFRQTDPVYTLDLRDPRRPRVTGELKINGYSAYLHPVDDKTLIGVGQEATGQGQRLGTQVSVFDVGDPARPRRVAQHHVRDSSSEAEFDPHAFLYWPKTGLLVVPLTVHSGARFDAPESAGAGALVLELQDGSLTERGVVRHPVSGADASIRRSMMIGDALWTVSAAGVRADDAASLQQKAWLPFR
jgi:hypothetical protein